MAIPNAKVPLLLPDGTLTLPWRLYLQGVSGSGSIDPAIIAAIEAQIAAIQAEIATLTGRVWAPTVGTPGRRPTPGEELFNIPITFGTSLPINLEGSIASCEMGPQSNATFPIYKNGINVGSVTFPQYLQGPNVGRFVFPSAQTFNPPNDNFSFAASTAQDPTLSGISVQFLGEIT